MAGIITQAAGLPEQPVAPPEQAPRAVASARDLVLAVQGALFDERAGGAEKIIAAAEKARDPVMSIAKSAADIVGHVAEQIGFQGGRDALMPAAMMAMGQLIELAKAAGLPATPDQAAKAMEVFKRSLGLINDPPQGTQQPAPPVQPQPEIA